MRDGRWLLMVPVALAGWGCSKVAGADPSDSSSAPPTVTAPVIPEPPPVREESPIDVIARLDTFTEALAMAKPRMGDSTGGRSDPGAVLFSGWAMAKMKWADVAVTKDETTVALVRKDSDEERGKRLCTSGSIIQISTEKTSRGKAYEGLLHTDGGNLIDFIMVGSSGALVEHSYTRLCGVVTGTYDYPNSGGGTGHAVTIVGMFDLPQNRAVTKTKE